MSTPDGRYSARSTVGSVATALATLALVLADRLPEAALAAVAVATVADLLPWSGPRWAAAVVAAFVLASGVHAVHDFPSAIVGGLLALALGAALMPLRTLLDPPLAGLALAGSVLGVYLTVPDTEWMVGLGVVLLPLLVAHEIASRPTPPPSAFALATLLAWVAADSARGRAGAAVGALACLLLLVLIVAAARLAGAETAAPPRNVVVLLIHAGAVLTCARVAGVEEGIAAAVVIAVPVLTVVTVAESVVLRDA